VDEHEDFEYEQPAREFHPLPDLTNVALRTIGALLGVLASSVTHVGELITMHRQHQDNERAFVREASAEIERITL
jgi:hypothetical protein